MTKIELLDYLVKRAKEFRTDHGHYARNVHMHEVKEAPSKEVIDAALRQAEQNP